MFVDFPALGSPNPVAVLLPKQGSASWGFCRDAYQDMLSVWT
jgi:hypothetical protein